MISTIGIHESRGYARQFSSIGVKPELAEIFQTEAFAASDTGGAGFEQLDADTDARHKILAGDEEAKPAKTARFYPKVYKAAIATANGTGDFAEYSQKVRDLEAQSPISMRHVMGLKKEPDREPVDPADVDVSVGHHDYPIVISSMSFGSQSEPAFRAYAEAGKAINILCINGEGGEIQDMYGNYRKWRGQQVASGRFGVSAEMLNSLLRRRDQDRPGRQARRGRPPARQEGLREGRRGPERLARHRPDQPLEQPRPLLDRGPGRADRRAEDGQPRPARLGQGPGGAERRHDRPRHRQGGRRHHHPLRLRGRHRRRAPARAAPRRASLGYRHPRGAPGADGGRDPKPGRDLGRRRLPPRPRHREAPLHGREPRRLRHAGDGLARLHDLPRLPARHLPRRHRHPDRDQGAGRAARAQEVHAAGRPTPPRAAPASSARWARR